MIELTCVGHYEEGTNLQIKKGIKVLKIEVYLNNDSYKFVNSENECRASTCI